MSGFYEVCDRLADIVPPLRGRDHPCGDGMIGFCRWCQANCYAIDPDNVYVQEVILNSMTPEEIQSAYARWMLEKEES